MKRLLSILLFLLFVFSVPCSSNAAENPRLMVHKQWASLIAEFGSRPCARMASWAENDRAARIFLDFLTDDSYVISISYAKGEHRGKTDISGLRDHEFQTRVDDNLTFYTQGAIAEDEDDWIFLLGKGFGGRFIEEAKEGDYLRVKLFDTDDKTILRFSLQGFTAAFNRTRQLQETLGSGQGDGSYFDGERPRTRQKSDAFYF